MILMGLTISIVIPNVGASYDKFKFRSEARRLVELVQRAKFQAFYYQRNVRLSERERRMEIEGLDDAGDGFPSLEVTVPEEIRFSANGVASGGAGKDNYPGGITW